MIIFLPRLRRMNYCEFLAQVKFKVNCGKSLIFHNLRLLYGWKKYNLSRKGKLGPVTPLDVTGPSDTGIREFYDRRPVLSQILADSILNHLFILFNMVYPIPRIPCSSLLKVGGDIYGLY